MNRTYVQGFLSRGQKAKCRNAARSYGMSVGEFVGRIVRLALVQLKSQARHNPRSLLKDMR